MENNIEQPRNLFTPLTIVAVVVFLAVIFSNFYFFYFKKNYEFIVETACDPLVEQCSQRDCSEEGFCPPNELSDFKRYSINANDFQFCTNEDCTSACESQTIECLPLECEENIDYGETCSLPRDSGTEPEN